MGGKNSKLIDGSGSARHPRDRPHEVLGSSPSSVVRHGGEGSPARHAVGSGDPSFDPRCRGRGRRSSRAQPARRRRPAAPGAAVPRRRAGDAGRRCWPSSAPTSTTCSPRSPTSCAAASGCAPPSSTGGTGPRAAPTPTRWCGWPARWSCSRPPRSSTTTSWTTPTPAAGCRPRTARSPPGTPPGAGPATSDRFGLAGAVLAGNLCLTWTDAVYATCGLPEADLERGRPVFDLMRTQLMAGQFLDVVESMRPWEGLADDERVERAGRVIRYKSAKYTVEHPLLIGATTGGLDAAGLAALSRYGLDLGRAFQLRDDLLGVFGDPGRPASRPATTCARASARCCSPTRSPAPTPPGGPGSRPCSGAPTSTPTRSTSCATSSRGPGRWRRLEDEIEPARGLGPGGARRHRLGRRHARGRRCSTSSASRPPAPPDRSRLSRLGLEGRPPSPGGAPRS